ncbi:MAG: zinc-ribbon domain-containing protein, partial [Syntrophomonas sp.]
MAYCRQCAAQLSDSDMFCTVCGTPQSPGVGPSAAPRAAQPNERMNEIITVASGMLSKPVSTIKSATTVEFPSMAILGGIIAVVTGLLVMWMV